MAEAAAANLCQYTDDILFSSSPYDYKEPTHFNVQPVEYWVRLFARHGFIHDVDFDATFITPWAMRLRRVQEPLPQVVYRYERRFWAMNKQNNDLRGLAAEMNTRLRAFEETQRQLEQDVRDGQKRIELQAVRIQELEEQAAAWQLRWEDLERGAGWKALRRLRQARLGLLPPGSRREQAFYWLLKGKRK